MMEVPSLVYSPQRNFQDYVDYWEQIFVRRQRACHILRTCSSSATKRCTFVGVFSANQSKMQYRRWQDSNANAHLRALPTPSTFLDIAELRTPNSPEALLQIRSAVIRVQPT